MLAKLADKSLLHLNPDGRYAMHELLRRYLATKLAEAGAIEPVRNQHLNYYLKLAEEAEPLLRGPERFIALQQVEAELDNLRAALEWAFECDRADAYLRL